MQTDSRIPLTLLTLRISVFIVMIFWTLDKFFNPDHTAKIFQHFYAISGLNNSLIYVIGAVQLIIILGFVAGFQKKWTYLLVLFLHSASTFSSFKQYLDPFNNLLFFAAFPMLAACFTLFLLKDLDTLWTID